MGIDRRRIANVCVIDGRSWTPASTVHRLEELIRRDITRLHVQLVRLGPLDNTSVSDSAFTVLADLHLPTGSLIVGIGLAGLMAAKYQERERPDLHVITVCSPCSTPANELLTKSNRRVAFYCGEDKQLVGRVADWSSVAESYDIPFLRFGCDRHPYSLASLIVTYLNDGDLAWEIKYTFDRAPIQIPPDKRYQSFVDDCVKDVKSHEKP